MFSSLVESLVVDDDVVLVERLRANELEIRRLTAEQAATTREIERRRLFQDDGHRSVKAFLRANLGLSGTQAKQLAKVAKLLDTVDGVGDALLGGHIGVAQANELGRIRANPRVGDQLAEVAVTLLDAAEQMKFEDFRIVGLRWESQADADGAERREANNIDHRDATVIDANGDLFMRASGGSAVEAAELTAVFASFAEHEFRVDCAARDAEHGPNAPTSLMPRSDKQRRRDALQHIFRAAQAALDAGVAIGPIPTVVNIVASQFDVEHALASGGLVPRPIDLVAPPLALRRKETSSGAPIGDEELVRATIHGRVRSVIMDRSGMPISYGRTRRLFTGPIRQLARLLGHRCAHPGCTIAAERCEIDHVTEFAAADGETSIANAGLECSSHNRFKHRSRLGRVRLGTDHVITTRADGSEMRPVGQRNHTDKMRARLAAFSTHSDVVDAIHDPLNHVIHLRLVDGEFRLAA